MTRWIVALAWAACAWPASAQMLPGGDSDFKALNFQGDEYKMNMTTGRFDYLRGNAFIELIPADAKQSNMKIHAGEFTFSYSGEGEKPDAIVMTGSVRVSQPPFNIEADRGEWKGDVLVLTGDPVVVKNEGAEYQGAQMTFNRVTGEVSVKGAVGRNVPLNAMGGGGAKQEANPFLLTAADITDWPALIGGVKKQAAADGPSPGKQIMAQFDPKLREQFKNVVDDKAPNAPTQADLVKALNRVLHETDLYDADAWKGVEIGDEAAALLKKESLSSTEVVQLNRRLLEAAYPTAVKRRG